MNTNLTGPDGSQAFNSGVLGSPLIRDQYRSRHHGHAPSVRWNDVFFAVHAFVISSLTLLQSLVYQVRTLSSTKPTPFAKTILCNETNPILG